MMKAFRITLLTLVAIMASTSVPTLSLAQYQEDYNIETIERNLSRAHEEEGGAAQKEYSEAMNEAYDTQNSPQINIYNANSNANKQDQKAKVDALAENENKSNVATDINAEVGNEYISRSNDIRTARKNLEIGTEQKIVEKIEWSRMEDEKYRADRLFGNRLDKNYDNDYRKEEAKVVIVEKPAYVAPAYHEPAYAPAKPLVAAYDSKPAYEVRAEEKVYNNDYGYNETYIAPMIGSFSYSADNVRTDSAMGLAFGSRMENISLEASFIYAELEMDDYRVVGLNGFQVVPGLKEVTQYGFGGAIKYNFGFGRVSPFLGVLASYTMRDYQEVRVGNGTAESTAFDAGLTVGADVRVAKNFSLGLEYRILRNVTNDREEETIVVGQQTLVPQFAGRSLEPLEEMNQQMLLFNGKLSF